MVIEMVHVVVVVLILLRHQYCLMEILCQHYYQYHQRCYRQHYYRQHCHYALWQRQCYIVFRGPVPFGLVEDHDRSDRHIAATHGNVV